MAYADFVTAMMALFIVLWLMSADEKVKEEISAFFNNPTGPGKESGTAAAGAGHAIQVTKEDMNKLREKMEQAIKTLPNFRDLKDHVEMTITVDGLRIEMLETEAGMFFESGRPLPSESGAELLKCLAKELGQLPNDLLIEGHTDSKPFMTKDGYYSNWELSSDRANAARRLMEANGLRHAQVNQVRGFADRQLRHPDSPEHASNRRVSVIVQYLTPPPKAPGETGKEAAKEGGKENAKEGEKKTAEGGKPAEPAKPAAGGKPAEPPKPAAGAEPAKPAAGGKPAEAAKKSGH